MNKNVKGAIAVGAGALLLLGGGGTFALWNDAITISGTQVKAGELFLHENGAGAWSTDAAGLDPILDIDAYAIVPGTTIYYTLPDVEITAGGNDLYYAFITSLSDAAITAGLDDYFTVSSTLTELTPSEDTFFPTTGTTPVGTYISTTPDVSLDQDDVVFYDDDASVTGDPFKLTIAISFSADVLQAQLEELSLANDVVFALVQVVKV